MRPWIFRAIPMLAVPIVLIVAVAACGPATQSPSNNETGARGQEVARGPVIDQLGLAQPARIVRAQEEEAPVAEAEPAEDVPVGDAPPADAPAAEEAPSTAPDEEPPVSEVPAPVTTAEPAAAAPTSTPAPVAGAPTPTLDLATVLADPAIQTAVAQFSNMAPPLPPIPNQSGQPPGAQPAAQTQAAMMMATLTTPK